MNFVLTGFDQDAEFRVFVFQGIGADGARSEYTVRADLGLIRNYGIRLQELPLLCRGLLDRLADGEEARTLTFTEDVMRIHANKCAAEKEATMKRKAPRSRPPTEQQAGSSWRTPHPQP